MASKVFWTLILGTVGFGIVLSAMRHATCHPKTIPGQTVVLPEYCYSSSSGSSSRSRSSSFRGGGSGRGK